MEFNIKRIISLLKLDLKHLVIPTLLIVSLIFFVISIINTFALYDHQGSTHIDNYPSIMVFLYISMAIMGAISFTEINNRGNRIAFLNLPASAIEKTISKFLATMIAFPILFSMVTTVMTYLFNAIAKWLVSGKVTFSHLPDDPWTLFTAGLIICSFFAYGSIKYNTASFAKIIVWGLALFALFALGSFIFGLLIYPEIRATVFGYEYDSVVISTDENVENHWIIKFVIKFYYVVPLLFWTLVYFTLKEKEA